MLFVFRFTTALNGTADYAALSASSSSRLQVKRPELLSLLDAYHGSSPSPSEGLAQCCCLKWSSYAKRKRMWALTPSFTHILTHTHTIVLGQIHTLFTTQVVLTGGVGARRWCCIFQQRRCNSPLSTLSTPSTKNNKKKKILFEIFCPGLH